MIVCHCERSIAHLLLCYISQERRDCEGSEACQSEGAAQAAARSVSINNHLDDIIAEPDLGLLRV